MPGGHGPRDPFSAAAVRAAYDRVAADYTAAFADDLQWLPVERLMLDTALAECPPVSAHVARALDLGCGPASVAAYLAANDAAATGVDFSDGMLRQARNRYPGLPLVRADLRRLPFPSASAGLAVAYFSIQHLPRHDLPVALEEIGRVLVAGGVFVVATHLGAGEVSIDNFLGHHIDPVGGALYGREELIGRVQAAGFRIDLEKHRGPLPHEADTQRIFLLARASP
jgi:ubiquinone/menaquinone biosynthesis C-methylase UbiE